uniref:GH10 domain-containing protein n=1 Tax=candidate division WWE3 bacterium TaxID=2053526 RepID=A0A7C4TLQ1_UNCKA
MRILPKKKPWYQKEAIQAINDIKDFFHLHIIRIILIILIVLVATPVILFIYYKPVPHKKINYGVTFSWKYAAEMGLDWKETYLQTLDDLQARNLRLVVYWEDTEPTKDNYDYSNIKWQLEEADKRNANVILSIGRKVPRYPECFEPKWWRGISSKDIRDQELYEYIKKTVTELKHHSSIKMWQVENEPFWPFGDCPYEFSLEEIKRETALVRDLDPDRPILSQDSGEGGLWFKTYEIGDYLGISMYRKIWYDFWGIFGGRFVYFQYPLQNWTYAIKAGLVGVPIEKIIVTELQAEPWGPGLNSKLTQEEKDHTMSRNDFYATIDYAQRAGFKDLYLWGVEWWYWEKLNNNNPFFWDTAKALFR